MPGLGLFTLHCFLFYWRERLLESWDDLSTRQLFTKLECYHFLIVDASSSSFVDDDLTLDQATQPLRVSYQSYTVTSAWCSPWRGDGIADWTAAAVRLIRLSGEAAL